MPECGSTCTQLFTIAPTPTCTAKLQGGNLPRSATRRWISLSRLLERTATSFSQTLAAALFDSAIADRPSPKSKDPQRPRRGGQRYFPGQLRVDRLPQLRESIKPLPDS